MKLKKVLKRARKEGWAIPQLNFSSLEQFKGIINASLEMSSPVILGTSEGEASFLGLSTIVSLANEARERGAMVFLNLDHGHSFDPVSKAVEAGYDMVHIDASHLSLEDNIELSRKVRRMAPRRVLVEGEIGWIKGGSDKPQAPKLQGWDLTDVEEVHYFIKKSKVDLLAPAVGSVHGAFDEMPEIEFSLLESIRSEAGRRFLVFHGASGVSPSVLKRVVNTGVQKVNINTVLRRAWRSSLEDSLDQVSSVKPYKVLPRVVDAVQKQAERYISLLGSANKIN